MITEGKVTHLFLLHIIGADLADEHLPIHSGMLSDVGIVTYDISRRILGPQKHYR